MSARQRLQAAADPVALELENLALRSPDPKVRKGACVAILDRSGYGPSSKLTLESPHEAGEQLAKLLGVPAWQIEAYVPHDPHDLALRIHPATLAQAAEIGAQLAAQLAGAGQAAPAAPAAPTPTATTAYAPYAAPETMPLPAPAAAVVAQPLTTTLSSARDDVDLADLDEDELADDDDDEEVSG